MRSIFWAIVLIAMVAGCATGKTSSTISDKERDAFNQKQNDTIRITNDSLEYEIVIIEPGFYFWLNSIAFPRGHYSQKFLEARNRLLVLEWNNRVMQPQVFDPNLYLLPIDYNPSIDYGYEVNYQLYYYFIYFQRKYNQRLTVFVPRI
ncbi:DUF6146 family protein [Ascidiimonas aurantiaca]|uniref:DUF6146 family protein n=1 Tax=Ascidiimonas aurantiaca TaxID=1685432 RepID=UPI0030EB214A